ncbi:hypothetical protein B0H15DRAFT_262080 [Mycena belliarum]|uniref:Uncharacterized protein n=1 Tax=Mycena belliarum TaxID=1033014 RepID=A0AAD6U9J8_9AGAR|nr:hypothetical protein B0H15DRAFT_262080 [Mycena belliae]
MLAAHRPPSILLPSQPSTNSLDSTSSSSSDAASSASSHTSADAGTTPTMHKPRRIHFAPLPDPRRTDDDDDDTDNDLKSSDLPPPPQVCAPPPPAAPPPYASPARAHASLPAAPPSAFHAPTKSSTWPKPKSLLRPFRRGNGTPMSSSDSLTPTPSLIPEDAKWGVSLARWSSSGSTTGSPLVRTQSQSSTASGSAGKRRGRTLLSGFTKFKEDATAKRTNSVPPTNNPFATPSFGGKRGTRMLNGRVYGSRNANASPRPRSFTVGPSRSHIPHFRLAFVLSSPFIYIHPNLISLGPIHPSIHPSIHLSSSICS